MVFPTVRVVQKTAWSMVSKDGDRGLLLVEQQMVRRGSSTLCLVAIEDSCIRAPASRCSGKNYCTIY